MKCVYCGNEIPAGFNFCSVCGNQVNTGTASSGAAASPAGGGGGFYTPGGLGNDSIGGAYNSAGNGVRPNSGMQSNGAYSPAGGFQSAPNMTPRGGYSVPTAASSGYAAPQPTYGGYTPPQPQRAPRQPQEGKGQAIASMILGISSLVCTCTFYLSFIGFICSIIGLALANSSKNKGYTGGMRKAGFVTSLITMIIALIVAAFVVIALLAAAGASGF